MDTEEVKWAQGRNQEEFSSLSNLQGEYQRFLLRFLHPSSDNVVQISEVLQGRNSFALVNKGPYLRVGPIYEEDVGRTPSLPLEKIFVFLRLKDHDFFS